MSLFKPTLIALSVASMFSLSPAQAADHVVLDEISVVATVPPPPWIKRRQR